MKRAAALLTVYEREESKIVEALSNGTLCAEDIKTTLTALMRTTLANILAMQPGMKNWEEEDFDDRIAALEAENKSLRRAAREANWDGVRDVLKAAAHSVGLTISDSIDDDLGRQAISVKRRLNKVEVEVLEGDDVRQCAKPLLVECGADNFEKFISEPVTTKAAFEMVRKRHPSSSMGRIIGSFEVLYMEYFGDTPPSAIHPAKQEKFFAWLSRLPKTHGKSHGRNRATNANEAMGKGPQGKTLTKEQEISEADAMDHAIMEEIRAIEGISLSERRALLAERLVPRLTMSTLKKNRDSLSRLFRAAEKLGSEVPKVLSYKDLDEIVKRQAPDDELYVRVTKPKTRVPWTKDRITSFLTCAIYTGSHSKRYRSRRGRIVVRDATYWVPLIVLTLGSRISEILHLKKSDVVHRDGALCLALNWGPEHSGKSESAKRILPVPELLLQLGFAEWFKRLPEAQYMLFPEALDRSSTGDATSAFGKHLHNILKSLKLADFDQDFYAARKTLSSMLDQAGVQENRRQAIAGHRHGTVLNCHYTAHEVEQLKSALDVADFQLEISLDAKLGFPVIRRCNLGGQMVLDVDVTLKDNHQVATLLVREPGNTQLVFEYTPSTQESRRERCNAAQSMAALAKRYSLRMPRNADRRKAIEHLMAYA
ncbi:MAG: integrase [Sulfitobacter sp.]|uniref:integrase n=1 Tax=Sulfitobacter sp. TaxID=1903071 RepID=UPI0039E4FEC2